MNYEMLQEIVFKYKLHKPTVLRKILVKCRMLERKITLQIVFSLKINS